jgi:hypothetical protein
MSRLSLFLATTAVAALTFAPMLPRIEMVGFGAAFAKNDRGNDGNGNGGNGNGGNGGNGNGGSGKGESNKGGKGKDKATSTNGKSPETSKAKKKLVTKSVAKKPGKAASAAQTGVVDAALTPRELGKMNGALNASINAITAHIRNGQTTSGPVGLMAGLAIADARAVAVTAEIGEVLARDAAYDALSAALTEAGYDSVGDYAAAVEAGDIQADETIDGMIANVGGLNADGTFANPAPTEEEVTAAVTAAAEAKQGVTDAETALVDAWNKDGDAEALLGMARERLGLYSNEIAAAIAETAPQEEILSDDGADVNTDADADTGPAPIVPTGG